MFDTSCILQVVINLPRLLVVKERSRSKEVSDSAQCRGRCGNEKNLTPYVGDFLNDAGIPA